MRPLTHYFKPVACVCFSDKDAVYKVAARVKQDVGAVDFLVNNAGVVSGDLSTQLL